MTKYLRRYTNLPALIYLLHERKITLLDPETWDDKNDSHFLALYREKKSLKTVLALCFTETAETYHHWRVFSDGSSGACIEFNRTTLLNAIKKIPSVIAKRVTYLKLNEIRHKELKTRELPFIKRAPYQHECEFRFLYESKDSRLNALDIPIPLSCIDRITLSPWLHSKFSSNIKTTIQGIAGCGALKITRSTLIGNQEWKNLGESAI
jgi:hypothetical protein